MTGWKHWARVAAATMVVAVLAVGAYIGFSDGGEPTAGPRVSLLGARPVQQIVGDWPAKPTHPTSFVVADAIGPSVMLFSAPGQVLAEKPQLDNPTWEGLPVVFLVLDQQKDWLKVRVSMRPNETVAWVKRSQVKLRTVPNRIVVNLSTRTVAVFHGDDQLMEAAVAVGTERTPTPVGQFFVDGWVPLSGSGPYGAGQLSVAGFSNVLHSFGGGVGQIAIHGTNRPELMGEAVSNGCVRTDNTTINNLAAMAPLGTPVEVVA